MIQIFDKCLCCSIFLSQMDDIAALAGQDVLDRIAALEKENADLRQTVKDLKNLQLNSDSRLKALETRLGSVSVSGTPAPAAAAAVAADDEDDVDLFGSEDEEEDAEAAKVREQRLAEYAAKKSKKPALIAKSNVILDIKPWVIINDIFTIILLFFIKFSKQFLKCSTEILLIHLLVKL